MKSQRKINIIWYHLYVESKNWYKWTYIQNRNIYTLPFVKQRANGKLLYNSGALWRLRGVGWGGKWEGGSQGRGTHAYLWLIHVDTWQNPTQWWKVTILQLKINKLKKKIWQNQYNIVKIKNKIKFKKRKKERNRLRHRKQNYGYQRE